MTRGLNYWEIISFQLDDVNKLELVKKLQDLTLDLETKEAEIGEILLRLYWDSAETLLRPYWDSAETLTKMQN